jgi:hypothetical protein
LAERKWAEESLRERAQILKLTHDTVFVRSMFAALPFRFLEEHRMFYDDNDREIGWRYWTTLAMIAATGLVGIAMLLLVHV